MGKVEIWQRIWNETQKIHLCKNWCVLAVATIFKMSLRKETLWLCRNTKLKMEKVINCEWGICLFATHFQYLPLLKLGKWINKYTNFWSWNCLLVQLSCEVSWGKVEEFYQVLTSERKNTLSCFTFHSVILGKYLKEGNASTLLSIFNVALSLLVKKTWVN